jgi:maltooligosyltrehalose trehalohydrolase
MHEFKLWAPYAKKLAVKVNGSDEPIAMMGPDGRGWWSVAVKRAEPGMDYGFFVDDDPMPYPDPRSQRQPVGVHGLSRLYDQSAFVWNDHVWQAPPLSLAVIYEMHIGTFTSEGTFDAAIERLEYLVELGVTHVELMPVAAFPGGQGWGYDGVAIFAVADLYGGPDGLKRLINACHAHSLAVLLDVVYNHFGPVGNYTGKFAPYLTQKHCTPWGGAVNFEGSGSDEVRRFFCDNALMWMRDYHLDGLRLDAVHEFIDRSAVHFMEQLSTEVKSLSAKLQRPLVLIAESDLNDPRILRTSECGGYGMDAQWSDDFHHALFTFIHPENGGKGYYGDFGTMKQLAKALTNNFVQDGSYSIYRQRTHGRPADDLSPHQFFGYIQNHDQVGNRATGDRIAQIVGRDSAKVAAALVLTAPFIPMIFQGEEYAASTPFQYFADHEDPEMAKAVKAGRQAEFAAFGWNPDDIPDPESVETFRRSKLKWDEIHEGEHREMLDWYRSLIRLRRGSASLQEGTPGQVKVRFDEKQRWLVMARGLVMVMCNLGGSSKSFELSGRSSLLLKSHPGAEIIGNEIVLPPNSVAILSNEAS